MTNYTQVYLSEDSENGTHLAVWHVTSEGERVAWVTLASDLVGAVRYAKQLADASGAEFKANVVVNIGL